VRGLNVRCAFPARLRFQISSREPVDRSWSCTNCSLIQSLPQAPTWRWRRRRGTLFLSPGRRKQRSLSVSRGWRRRRRILPVSTRRAAAIRVGVLGASSISARRTTAVCVAMLGAFPIRVRRAAAVLVGMGGALPVIVRCAAPDRWCGSWTHSCATCCRRTCCCAPRQRLVQHRNLRSGGPRGQ
jgi:hypothetical protein